MSDKSNDQGRAYEFACLMALEEEISKYRMVNVERNSSYYASFRAWEAMPEPMKETLEISAASAVQTIFDLEPLIVEDGDDELTLLIQKDENGEEGDVRDILIIRRDIHWEIGLSIKHNHSAVKHCRLSPTLDFGSVWFGIPCSKEYWDVVMPIFDELQRMKNEKIKWNEISNKSDCIYVPLLTAFLDEINRSYKISQDISTKMTEFLLCKYDFYKLISLDNKRTTTIQGFNFRGTINNCGSCEEPKIRVPRSSLPTEILHTCFKQDKKGNVSKTTVEIYLNEGWAFSFRIHSAEKIACPSLKFDVQIKSMPSTVMVINKKWN